MVAEMSYHTVSNVVDSWELLRRIPDFEEKAGAMLFRKYFTIEPKAAKVFQFGDVDKLDDDFYKSPRLIRHASHYMKMVDRAVGMLGPDIELLTEIMLELGKTHYKFGVAASYYPPMGQALIETMGEILGDKFTPEMKDGWTECYQALAYDMIRAKNQK